MGKLMTIVGDTSTTMWYAAWLLLDGSAVE
jgi:hypothetical protein